MYRDQVFTTVFGELGLDEKGKTDLIFKPEFVKSLFGSDVSFVRCYSILNNREPRYSFAKEAFDLVTGLHPSFFASFDIKKRVNTLISFTTSKLGFGSGVLPEAARILINVSPEEEKKKSFNRNIKRRGEKVENSYEYFTTKVLNKVVIDKVNELFVEEDTVEMEFDFGKVSLNKFEVISILTSNLKRDLYQNKNDVELSPTQLKIFNTFLNKKLQNFSLERFESLTDSLITSDQADEYLEYKSCNDSSQDSLDFRNLGFELIYYSIIKALNNGDVLLALKIVRIYEKLKDYKINELTVIQ